MSVSACLSVCLRAYLENNKSKHHLKSVRVACVLIDMLFRVAGRVGTIHVLDVIQLSPWEWTFLGEGEVNGMAQCNIHATRPLPRLVD